MNEGKEITYRKAVGLQVKQQLREKNILQKDAAEKAGLTPYQMTCIINGYTNYTISSLTSLVAALDLEISISTIVFEIYNLLYD